MNIQRTLTFTFASTTVGLAAALILLLAAGRTQGSATQRPTASGAHEGVAAVPDPRIGVLLTQTERELVLTEMRMLLVAVASVSRDVQNKRYERAAKTAREAGLETALRIGGEHPAILRKLPLPMKKLGFAVHRDFDALAERLGRGQVTESELLRALTGALEKCAACHAAYRIVVEQ